MGSSRLQRCTPVSHNESARSHEEPRRLPARVRVPFASRGQRQCGRGARRQGSARRDVGRRPTRPCVGACARARAAARFPERARGACSQRRRRGGRSRRRCRSVVDATVLATPVAGPRSAGHCDGRVPRARRRARHRDACPCPGPRVEAEVRALLAHCRTVQWAHPGPRAEGGKATRGGDGVKLVTFDDGRAGRLDDGTVAELDVPTMREYFERGGTPNGREHAFEEVTLRAPIVPKKFLHTAGNFREHEEESKRVGWSHEIAPWIVFFQNVDAIVGPDEPIVYPEHLTEELDYELELAVVVAKDGKWFGPEEAADYIGGYVIFNDITARDIQRREMRSGVFSFCKGI